MQVRAYRLLPSSGLTKLATSFEQCVQAWAEQWGLPHVRCKLRAADTCPDQGHWRQHWRESVRSFWLNWQAGFLMELQAAIFPPDHGNAASGRPEIAPQAAEKALDELIKLLLACAIPENNPSRQNEMQPQNTEFAYASGAVQICITVGKQDLVCMLNDEACQNLLKHLGVTAEKLKPLPKLHYLHILRDTPVRLPVEIGQAEVSLSNLMSVGIGDVIRLETSVDAPVRVRGPGGEDMFSAYLGKVQDRIAIELTSQH